MGHVAAAALIIGQPLAVLATVLLPPVAMARRRAPRTAVALWGLALVLLAAWGATTYRAAVHAGTSAADGSLLGTVHWLALAVVASVASLLLVHRAGDEA